MICLQGIDTLSAEPQLVYACAGMAVPESIKPVTAKATRSTRKRAATPGQAAAPGETLNGVNSPTDADPATANVWTLSSRPEAPYKIW